jgi:hypothetical protein
MIIKNKSDISVAQEIYAKCRLQKFGLELLVSLYTPQLFSKNSVLTYCTPQKM